MATYPGIGETVKQQRVERGWTQEQLAEITKLGVRTIQRLETKDVAALSTLRQIAYAFEMSVAELTEKSNSKTPASPTHRVELLPRLTTGTHLAALVSRTEMFHHSHDELQSQEEVDLVSGFLQNIQDFGDIWSDLESGDHVKATFTLGEQLKDLEQSGFLVFGSLTTRAFKFPRMPEPNVLDMSTTIAVVCRADNPRIVRTELGEFVPILLEHPLRDA